MHYLLILFLLVHVDSIQELDVESSISEILLAASRENRLPTELLNPKDKTVLIAIRKTEENQLSTSYFNFDGLRIGILEDKVLFADNLYWINPKVISSTDKELSFSFITGTWGKKDLNYYEGSLTAELIDNSWNIRKWKIKKTRYSNPLGKSE